MKRLFYMARILACIAASLSMAQAQERTLVVQVNDAQDRPISGVRIGTRDRGFIGETTDVGGKTKIIIGSQTSTVSLELVGVNDGRDLVFMQPWDGRITAPPFKNNSENFVLVVLIPRRLRQFIENGGSPQGSLVPSLSHRSAHPTPKKNEK
jgi:hypothetical protein